MSTKFSKAMNKTTTWNGALSLSSPNSSHSLNIDGLVSLFFKTSLGMVDEQINEYMELASKENLIDIFILAFHIRDCREGKGLRTIGRKLLVWLFLNYPVEFSKVYHLIPEYGRWDDMFCFFPSVIEKSNIPVCNINSRMVSVISPSIVDFYGKKLIEDEKNMKNGERCSLSAKWSPSENDSMDKKYKTFSTLAKAMKISPRNLRKKYNTPLRSYLNVVERFICSGKWDHIDYNKVPSCAMKKLRKAFEKHDSERFLEWRNGLESGRTKVNAKQLQPFEIVREFRTKHETDPVLEAQWKVIVEETKKTGVLSDSVIVVDTSSSMDSPNYLPLDIAVSMGMLISECVQGPFHNHIITFHTNPKFIVVKDGREAYDRWRQIRNCEWGGSTDIQKVFDMILERCKNSNLTDEDMPKRLFIINDIQFY